MKKHLILIVLFCFADFAIAAKQTSSTPWGRSSAMAAAQSVNVDVAV